MWQKTLWAADLSKVSRIAAGRRRRMIEGEIFRVIGKRVVPPWLTEFMRAA